jgi:hypothetical protein
MTRTLTRAITRLPRAAVGVSLGTLALLAAGAGAAPALGGWGGGGVGRPGVIATVYDASTGAPLGGATMVTRGPYRTSTARATAPNVLEGGDDGEGVVDVTVSRPGYADWHRRVDVHSEGGCSPVTTFVIVRMTPS